jgi:hypothetical protein
MLTQKMMPKKDRLFNEYLESWPEDVDHFPFFFTDDEL